MPSLQPDSETPAPSHRPPLPKQFTYTQPLPALYYQGAEALLYRTTFLYPQANSLADTTSHSEQAQRGLPAAEQQAQSQFFGTPIPAALKHRPSKPYRHPALDAKLTRHRILAEARVLAKLRREGVNVPALLALDWNVSSTAGGDSDGGWMLMEWIDGETVRAVLDRELEGYVAREETARESAARVGQGHGLQEGEEALVLLMRKIGALVGRVHELGVVHGDLTTSNLMVRSQQQQLETGPTAYPEVVLLDFGLAAQSVQDEDRAVDLYVLERAFGSTHPRTEGLFGEVLDAYSKSYKGAKVTLKRLEEVRMRGRKKIMIG